MRLVSDGALLLPSFPSSHQTKPHVHSERLFPIPPPNGAVKAARHLTSPSMPAVLERWAFSPFERPL